jgi:hypothetical protein
MKSDLEQEGVRPGFETGAGPQPIRRGRPLARRGVPPRDSAIAPVYWLRGEAPLRTYRAQSEQCQQLYDRGRAEGLYGRGGAEPAAGCEPDPKAGCETKRRS